MRLVLIKVVCNQSRVASWLTSVGLSHILGMFDGERPVTTAEETLTRYWTTTTTTRVLIIVLVSDKDYVSHLMRDNFSQSDA